MSEPANAGFQLSPQQKRAWSSQDGTPRPSQVAVMLEGPVELPRLKNALSRVVERYEILRTSFQRNAGMRFPFQVVGGPNPEIVWNEISAGSMTTERIAAEIFASRTEVDSSSGPAIFADLATLQADRHLLVLSVPGLCADEGSLGRIILETRDLYAGAESTDAEPLQYADYSEWQNELLQQVDEEGIAGREFWAQLDQESVPAVHLPFEIRSSDPAPFLPQTISAIPDDTVSAWLESQPLDNAASFLLTTWQLLASRLSGNDQVVVAEVSDGRQRQELRDAVGLLCKTLPRYANFAADGSFAAAVAETGRQRANSEEYRDFLAPLEQHLTAGFRIASVAALEPAGGVSFTILKTICFSDRFRLELRCVQGTKGWTFELIYDAACFAREVASRIAKQFELLLHSAVTSPDAYISRLAMLDEAGRHEVLVDFNRTAADFPRDLCIHQLFEEQVKRTPERVALRCGEVTYTYAGLDSRANRLAQLLRKHGIVANAPVGLCVVRSAEMIVGLLGILKAGGCYVPLIPDSPRARLSHQLHETNAPVVVTQIALLNGFPEYEGAVICIDRELSGQDSISSTEEEKHSASNNNPDNLVYVIYTSGSTGNPKGVAVRHRSLVNYASFICRLLGVDQDDAGLQFATVSTIGADLGNTCIFPSLISGGCLHVIPEETAMAANLYAKHALSHPIDVLKITPSHLRTLLSVDGGKGVLPAKVLILGGEASSWDFVEKIVKLSACRIINHYGPTEATVGCCTFDTQTSDARTWPSATVPIGRPIANDEIYILDKHLQPVSVGVPGELCIGGAGVAVGYLNQPQQTAERFVANPFSPDPEARIYRTGDLARFLPDGNIEFLGRIDQQVKIRGFRVEPAEIEAVLKKHLSLRDVVVLPYDDTAGEKRLAAYFVPSVPVQEEDLRDYLLQRLPNYMIPSAFLGLDLLPMTPNGKVDLRALPSPVEHATKKPRAYIAPDTPAEAKLVEIWKEVLRVEQVSVTDNFFDLGGHSLMATQIISRIRNGFQVQMPLHSFLETPTVRALAEKLAECPAAESEADEMARLLAELEGLTDEEAEALLAAEAKEPPIAGGKSGS